LFLFWCSSPTCTQLTHHAYKHLCTCALVMVSVIPCVHRQWTLARTATTRPCHARLTNTMSRGASFSEATVRPDNRWTARPSSSRKRPAAGCCYGVRSQRHSRNSNRGAESIRISGAIRMSGGAKRHCDRAPKRKSYRVGPKVSSWPNILTVNPY
jgi:hypothetical protein